MPKGYYIRPVLFFLFGSICMGKDFTPTVSPESEFIRSPRNQTVLEGEPVVLRCKIRDIVNKCQWFHLPKHLNIFEHESRATLAKDFIPINNRDCSIKINKSRVAQTGQWICKALQIQRRKYVVSRPAFLTVYSLNGTTGRTDQSIYGDNDGIEFLQTREGNIVYAHLGESASMSCQANHELTHCDWKQLENRRLNMAEGRDSNYVSMGSLVDGNCTLYIRNVSERDEGNWKCIVGVRGLVDEKFGPMIHLHVHGIGVHSGISSFYDVESASKLPAILGATSIILTAIIVGLVFYMYNHVWKKKRTSNVAVTTPGSEKSDCSNYDVSWQPELRLHHQKFWPNSSSSALSDDSYANINEGYLDMTGDVSKEGYVMFPAASIRSSMSSRTTMSTIPATCGSPRISASDSVSSSGGNTSADIENIQNRKLPERTPSLYSHNHLYEEIKYGHSPNIQEETDIEGYLVPSECTNQTEMVTENDSTNKNTSSYCTVGIRGPETENNSQIKRSTAFNPMYTSANCDIQINTQESYDVPKNNEIPAAPPRTDSIGSPLANYDVPKKADECSSAVFV